MTEPRTPTGKAKWPLLSPEFSESADIKQGRADILAIEAEAAQQERERPMLTIRLKELLPGLPALLALDAAAFGAVIATRPDVWDVLRAFLKE